MKICVTYYSLPLTAALSYMQLYKVIGVCIGVQIYSMVSIKFGLFGFPRIYTKEPLLFIEGTEY